jgi:hypothetical protein
VTDTPTPVEFVLHLVGGREIHHQQLVHLERLLGERGRRAGP